MLKTVWRFLLMQKITSDVMTYRFSKLWGWSAATRVGGEYAERDPKLGEKKSKSGSLSRPIMSDSTTLDLMWSWCHLTMLPFSSFTMKDKGPACSYWRVFTKTVCPSTMVRSWGSWSWALFCWDCFSSAADTTFGNNRSTPDLGILPNSNSAGALTLLNA